MSKRKESKSKRNGHILYLILAIILIIGNSYAVVVGEVRLKAIHFVRSDEPLNFWFLVIVGFGISLYGFYLYWAKKSFYD